MHVVGENTEPLMLH